MAGHSKWANIKHQKAKADAKKGKLYSLLAKQIISAAKQGSPNPDTNTKLRTVITRAKAAGLPNDIIARNLAKASNKDQSDFADVTYELYGYGGVGIIIEAMTDNVNRAAANLNVAIKKHGGSFAQPGSVVFNFKKIGIIRLKKSDTLDEDTLFMAATEALAEDFEFDSDGSIVITQPDTLMSVAGKLEAAGLLIESTEFEMVPNYTVDVTSEIAAQNQTLIDYIESLDEVDAIFHNMTTGTNPQG